jgi:serine/threonine protein kinase
MLQSMLDHPNIISVDGLRQFGVGGVVMEYAEYGTLRNVLEGKTSIDINRWAVKLCLDVAKGLYYLHTQNPQIIHRDLKTSNILVCKMDDSGTPIAKVILVSTCPFSIF